MPESAPWITYRPELKVLDCTLRDGGLVNAHQFSDDFARKVYETGVAAGIDYLEVGYKNAPRLFDPQRFGPLRHCDEAYLHKLFGDHDPEKTGLKLAAMADAGKSDWKTQIVPRGESVLDVIRVACYAHQISEAAEMIRFAHDLGYETTCNIMAISVVSETEIDQALEVIRDTPADTVVVVDSFGALYREQIDNLVRKYQHALEGTGKEIGIHAHNNLQLAFANTIEAIILGCNRADATLAGLGRGAGNCPTEILVGFLRNPKYRQRPIIEFLQKELPAIRERLEWGPLLPYNITGQMNTHPRAAIEWLESDERDDVVAFYDKIVADI